MNPSVQVFDQRLSTSEAAVIWKELMASVLIQAHLDRVPVHQNREALDQLVSALEMDRY
jgi:hypothetical protein